MPYCNSILKYNEVKKKRKKKIASILLILKDYLKDFHNVF